MWYLPEKDTEWSDSWLLRPSSSLSLSCRLLWFSDLLFHRQLCSVHSNTQHQPSTMKHWCCKNPNHQWFCPCNPLTEYSEVVITVLFTRVESYQCTLSFFSPVTFNHHVGGDTGGRRGRGGGGWGGEEGDNRSRGADRLVLLLWKNQRWQRRVICTVLLIPAALQEHQLLVVFPLWHKHILVPAHLAGLYHFVLTLKGCAKVLELVLNVFHWKETQKS